MRAAAVSLLLVLALGGTGAGAGTKPKPTGKKAARPVATHVVVRDAVLDMGAAKASLRAGVLVSAKGLAVTGATGGVGKGKARVKVTLVGGAELAGTIDGVSLGVQVAREVDLLTADGGQVLGKAPAGTVVRVITGKAKAKHVAVETVTGFAVKGQLPVDALTAQHVEFVLSGDFGYVTKYPTEIWAAADPKGKVLVVLPVETRIEVTAEENGMARVKSSGGVVIEGWTRVENLRPREAGDLNVLEDDLVKPSHEMFVDGPIFAASDGKRQLGTLRGGALVEVVGKPVEPAKGQKGALVKVITPGAVVVEGWVRHADLRELEQSVFRD